MVGSIVASLMTQKKSFIYFMFFMLLCNCDAFSGEFEPGGRPQIYEINPEAEVILAALINVRQRGPGPFGCGERRTEGLYSAEALKWVTDGLNRKIWSSSSSNLSIGLQIMDSCSRKTVATLMLMEFLPDFKGNELFPKGTALQYKFGVIDDIGLKNEVDMSHVLEELNVPVLRTDVRINSQQQVISGILNIMQELRWDHVALVHSNSRYSLSLLKSFIRTFTKFDLCIPWIINIENAFADEDYEELGIVLKSRIPIVSLLPSDQNYMILNSVKDVPKEIHKIPMLFTDLIVRSHLRKVPVNSVQLFSLVPLPEKDVNFEEYFWRNSKISDMKKEDDLEMMLRTKALRRMQRIMDKFSNTLRNLMEEYCKNKVHVCIKMLSPDGRNSAFEQLYEIDWSVERDLYGLMEYQFRNPESRILLHKVLTYNKFRNVDVYEENLPFVDVVCDNNTKPNRPECNCLEAKAIRRASARNIVGRIRKKTAVENTGNDSTTATPEQNQIGPYSVVPTAFSTFRHPINAIIASLILIGSVFTLFTAQYFATYAARPRGGLTYGTSIIGYIILIGLFFLYVTNLSFILTPSKVACTIRRFGPSSSYAVIFSGMMIKVWTVWRQTRSEKAEVPKPATLIILSLSFSSLQILLSGLWLALVPPRTHFDSGSWICYPSGDLDSHLLVSMAYVIVILLVTAVLAIHTSAKNNNSETRCILISSAVVAVLFSCWGVAIATGVLEGLRTAIMNLASATILLACLYIPKMREHARLTHSRRARPRRRPRPPQEHTQKFVKDFSAFTPPSSPPPPPPPPPPPALPPPHPLMMDYNVPIAPISTEDISDSGFSNEVYSIDGGTESISYPFSFEIDTTSISDIEQDPIAFTTFFNDTQAAEAAKNRSDLDPTQVVPSTLYSLDMFNNDSNLDEKDHYEPGTNEFTPQHPLSSQLYLYPMPEWVP